MCCWSTLSYEGSHESGASKVMYDGIDDHGDSYTDDDVDDDDTDDDYMISQPSHKPLRMCCWLTP